ncbi:MAG: hypothetical protein IJ756_10370 [Paludibacteraceae bacterium]|nr:hypothetical protein [Paludibacteraceae bacterium]
MKALPTFSPTTPATTCVSIYLSGYYPDIVCLTDPRFVYCVGYYPTSLCQPQPFL